MHQPDLSVVIVNWNVAPLLRRCLEAIQNHLNSLSIEVLVVDNASQDESAAMLADEFPWVNAIFNEENVGFAKANNQAFRLAKGKYVLVLNPDTEIQPGAIQCMLQLLENRPEIGLVGPKIINADGSIVRACKRPSLSNWHIAKGLFLTDKLWDFLMGRLFGEKWRQFSERTYQVSETTACLQGSCMLMRREDLLHVGFFDERVPLYLDDNDLCQRFRYTGLEVYYESAAEVLHVGARSVDKMVNSRMSSLVGSLAIDTYFLKHGSRGQVVVHHLMLFFSSIIFLLVDLLLWPFLWFSKRKFIQNYTVKHFWTLVYSIIFRFKTKSLPESWPRSLAEVLAAPSRQETSDAREC